MKRIDAFIEKMMKEEKYRNIGRMACGYIRCVDCPSVIFDGQEYKGCKGIAKLGKWLLEDVQTESYTEKVITAYHKFKDCFGIYDDSLEETILQYTYIIRTEEDERNAKERESGLRLSGYEVKVQDFIHEHTEVLPWNKEQE